MKSFYCQSVCWVIIVSIVTGISPTPFSPPLTFISVPFTESALSGRLFFFTKAKSTPQWPVFRQISAWFRGDAALRSLRVPYRRRLAQCFVLMASDAAASLTVPFIGQALYDAAAEGTALPGSFHTMIGVSALLLIIEGLDPLRRFVQFRLTQVSSGFVADVRVFLLKRALAEKPEEWDPALPGLIYFHGPSFAARNIELPLKFPLISAQAVFSGWLLWQMDSVIMAVAGATALVLFAWSHWRSRPLAQASQDLRQAESETVAVLERIAASPGTDSFDAAQKYFERVRNSEIQQARQNVWYDGVVDRISTLILMTGVMLWGTWHQYLTGSPSTGQILTLLALAWNVQYRISALLGLTKRRLEAESASFLLRHAV